MLVDLPNRRSTRMLARHVASVLRSGDLVILSGSLGAGKTFFVRALCRALGLPASERVTSPTFALVREVETTPAIAHADLYRLKSVAEVLELGLDAHRDDGRVLLVEWGEPYRAALGGDALVVDISLSPRRAALTASGKRSCAMLAELETRAIDRDPGLARSEVS